MDYNHKYIITLNKDGKIIMTSKMLTGTLEQVDQFAKISKVLFGADGYEISVSHLPLTKSENTPKQKCPHCGNTGIHYCQGPEVSHD